MTPQFYYLLYKYILIKLQNGFFNYGCSFSNKTVWYSTYGSILLKVVLYSSYGSVVHNMTFLR